MTTTTSTRFAPATTDAAICLAWLYTAAAALDVATTMFNTVNLAGIVEGNAVVAAILATTGVAGFVGVKLAAVLAQVLLVLQIQRRPERGTRIIWSMFICLAITYAAVAWNAVLALRAIAGR